MDDVRDPDLYQRTQRLLEPGDIELDGLIVHTDLPSEDDIEMLDATLAVGDVIAEHAGYEPNETYVYSGNDDPDFSSNQHQGLTLDGDEFVWECQQLLREGSYDLVFYFEAGADREAIAEAAQEETGFPTTAVEGR